MRYVVAEKLKQRKVGGSIFNQIIRQRPCGLRTNFWLEDNRYMCQKLEAEGVFFWSRIYY